MGFQLAETMAGTVAPPIAQGVEVEGVLTIRPVGQRIIRYELAFIGGSFRPLP